MDPNLKSTSPHAIGKVYPANIVCYSIPYFLKHLFSQVPWYPNAVDIIKEGAICKKSTVWTRIQILVASLCFCKFSAKSDGSRRCMSLCEGKSTNSVSFGHYLF